MYLQVLPRFGVGSAFLCPGEQRALAGAWTGSQMKCAMERITLPCAGFFCPSLSAGTLWGRNCLALCDGTMRIDGLVLG